MIKTKLVEGHQFTTNEFEKDINKAIRDLASQDYKVIDIKIPQMPGLNHRPGVALIIYDNGRTVYEEEQVLKEERDKALAQKADYYMNLTKDKKSTLEDFGALKPSDFTHKEKK